MRVTSRVSTGGTSMMEKLDKGESIEHVLFISKEILLSEDQ